MCLLVEFSTCKTREPISFSVRPESNLDSTEYVINFRISKLLPIIDLCFISVSLFRTEVHVRRKRALRILSIKEQRSYSVQGSCSIGSLGLNIRCSKYSNTLRTFDVKLICIYSYFTTIGLVNVREF